MLHTSCSCHMSLSPDSHHASINVMDTRASIVFVYLTPTRASTNLWRFDQLTRGSYRCGPLTVMKNVLHVRECNGFLMGGGGYIYVVGVIQLSIVSTLLTLWHLVYPSCGNQFHVTHLAVISFTLPILR